MFSAGRAKGLSAGEDAILEMIALGAPLSDVLDRLMRLNEARFEGLLASILLLNPANGCDMPLHLAWSLKDAP